MSEVASDRRLPEHRTSRGEPITPQSLPVRMIDPVIVQRAYAANVDALKALETMLRTDESC